MGTPRGRPRIGPRTELTARVPPELHEAARDEAERLGISISKLVIDLLQEKLTPESRADASQVA